MTERYRLPKDPRASVHARACRSEPWSAPPRRQTEGPAGGGGNSAAGTWWRLRGRSTRTPGSFLREQGRLCGRGGPARHEWRPCIEDLTGAGSHNTGAFHKPPRHRGGIECYWWLTGRRGVRRTHGPGGTTLLLLLTLCWPAGLDGEGGEAWMPLSEGETCRVILSIA